MRRFWTSLWTAAGFRVIVAGVELVSVGLTGVGPTVAGFRIGN